jgi:SWIM/SEC-C metal-binding protein
VARIGTKKHPAVVRVATEERARQILELCNQHGIQAIVGIEPDQPDDISDVERILRCLDPGKAAKAPPRITGNDYCPCGSGKKYKKCCAPLNAG